ncbi:MAG: hypothetical protein GF401_14680 [Chitinivibrionales bacterium]|nr:hypothetical protein [Chitinivibrionales bacterium]
MATLIYHAGGVGDFITTLPTVKLWNRNHLGHHRIFLGKKATGILGKEYDCFDEILDIDKACFCRLFSSTYKNSKELPPLYPGLSSALVFADNNSPLITNLKRSGIDKIVSQEPIPDTDMLKIRYHYEALAGYLGKEIELENCPYLIPQPVHLEKARHLAGEAENIVAIHPGSGSVLKNWPKDRFEQIAAALHKNGYTVFWIAGPDDPLPDGAWHHNILRNKPLPHVAAFLSQCTLFIGNDSGIAHLAGAVGCPGVVIFGPSDPRIWKPFGAPLSIVQSTCLCSPCHAKKKTGPHCTRECIESVTVRNVLENVFSLIS